MLSVNVPLERIQQENFSKFMPFLSLSSIVIKSRLSAGKVGLPDFSLIHVPVNWINHWKLRDETALSPR